mgnify:CR=1 FL=1
MIRQYSRKYLCPICKKEGRLIRLYSEMLEDGKRGLFCDKHGFQQYCNCSPSELELIIVED